MADDEDCNTILKKAVVCIMKILIDYLPLVFILFIVLFAIVGVYQSNPINMITSRFGISTGSGTRNQIEMFDKRVNNYKKK